MIGDYLTTPTGTLAIDRPVVIDASAAEIRQPSTVPLFSVAASVGKVTLEGVRLLGSSVVGNPTITVASGSLLRIVKSVLNGAVIEVVNGGLELLDTRVGTTLQGLRSVSCMNGTVSARAVEFEHTKVGATNCQLNVSRCRFDQIDDGSIGAQGGVAIIENNLFISSNEYADLMSVKSLAPGSAVRFNTFVNTSGVDSDGVALSCDGTATVTGNIFAYRSAHPLGPSGFAPCPTRFSLFDTVAVPQHTIGEGNQVADSATFFTNLALKDFRLSAASPAKQAAEPNLLVNEDFEGKPRPVPAGSRSDAGCFEAP